MPAPAAAPTIGARGVEGEEAMEWTFGTVLWSMVIFFFWFAFIWMFIAVFADILRRDMSGWAKAGWVLLILVLPFLGILIYLISRPASERPAGGLFAEPKATAVGTPGYRATDEIARAAQLRDEGRITADEYEHLKQRALSSS
jgi:hypothetical protein